jgi:hypothetical protein
MTPKSDALDWELLERLLKNHDWFYAMSDSLDVMNRGQAFLDGVLRPMLKLAYETDEELADALFEKHAPKQIHRPGKRYAGAWLGR